MGDQVQQLRHFGLEGKGLFLGHLVFGVRLGMRVDREGNRPEFKRRSSSNLLRLRENPEYLAGAKRRLA
jgi:hypothetical protein